MCGRIVRVDEDELEDWLRDIGDAESATRIWADLSRYVGRYNIAPTQEDVILRPAASGGRELAASR
jgi:putative SOS response-associated peptidase YedK